MFVLLGQLNKDGPNYNPALIDIFDFYTISNIRFIKNGHILALYRP